MQVRPHITLLFILSIFTVLFSIALVFDLILIYDNNPDNDNGNKIFLYKDFGLSFSRTSQIFSEKKKQYAQISNIIQDTELVNDSLLTEFAENAVDSLVIDTTRANADSLKTSIPKLEFPKGKRNILHPVFKALESANSSGKVVRIMHYGDSQIEGDRITSFLRNKLQSKFGGRGVGLLPARQLYDFRYSILQESSVNWFRYTLYGRRDTLIRHKRYGLLANFSSFTPQPLDSTYTDSSKKTAWISFKKSPYSYQNTKDFEQCRLFYGNSSQGFSAKLFVDNEVVDSGNYYATSGLKQINWRFDEPINNCLIELQAVISPEIYGIALDGKSGVAVDNIAMRGSAGLVFTKMDPTLFKQMIEKLNVKLLILEFGGNIVPNVRKDYTFYENWFYSQLKYIRKYAPTIEIIVIGVADMSRKNNNEYESYPNIELVRDAMKRATFKADAIYWDMYEAMGGKNSMPSWVFAQPPLAGSDFVHFNPKGAKIIANMFYNSFMYEYYSYKKQTK